MLRASGCEMRRLGDNQEREAAPRRRRARASACAPASGGEAEAPRGTAAPRPSRERGGGRWSSATVKRLPARGSGQRERRPRALAAPRPVPLAGNGLCGGTGPSGAGLSSGQRVRAAPPALAPHRGLFRRGGAVTRWSPSPGAPAGLRCCQKPPVRYLAVSASLSGCAPLGNV